MKQRKWTALAVNGEMLLSFEEGKENLLNAIS